MSENRDEILANFQACTGIEDYGEAIQHLETANWVLVDAVNRALPGSGGGGGGLGEDVVAVPGLPPGGGGTERDDAGVDPLIDVTPRPEAQPELLVPPSHHSDSMHFNNVQGFNPFFGGMMAGPSRMGAGPSGGVALAGGVTLADDFLPMGNSQRSRLLELNIEYRDRMIQLKVRDTESIQVVKTLLQNETGVAPCQQELRGWKGVGPFPATDRRLLSELNLPKENFLYLLTPEIPEVVGNLDPAPPPSNPADQIKYKLTIIDLHHDKTYNLTFPGGKQVAEVKRDVAIVTNIPVFRQSWTGWPDGILESSTLGNTGLALAHTLTVTQSPGAAAGPSMPSLDQPLTGGGSAARGGERRSDNSGEEAEEEEEDEEAVDDTMVIDDDDDDIFLSHPDIPTRCSIQPLLPDDFGDESLAGIKFGEEFSARYGHPSPHFFPGSLDDALTESCNKPAQERRMLAVYLHHDTSVLTNVFCTQVLCADAVIGLLSENFVTWGWDMTFPSNKQRLLDMISRHFGSVAAATIRNFEIEKLPLVILIAKLRGNLEIFQVIHGNTTIDEFMSSLLSAGESYLSQIGVEKREEEERSERDMMKQEQERAFQEAQLADQVRENQMKEAEAEARLQEEVEEAKRRSEQEAKEAEERRRKEEQEAAQAVLAPEPPADSPPQEIANIRFRTPTETLTRRFLATEKLATLLLYLASKGYLKGEYKILSSWPRRDLSVLDHSSTLSDLKLCPQETLTIEAKSTGDSDSE